MAETQNSLAKVEFLALYKDYLTTKRAIRLDATRKNSSNSELNSRAATKLKLRLQELLKNEELAGEIKAHFVERARVLRQAIQLFREDQKAADAVASIAQIRDQAARSARFLTTAEQEQILTIETAERLRKPDKPLEVSESLRADVFQAVSTLKIKNAFNELAAGLLITPQMSDVIAGSEASLLRGDPLLLIGETGGAKTALAEHLAQKISLSSFEFISGFGDISSAQVIGTHELRAENGATVTQFVAGPLLRAIQDGKPVILDEINAMPPEFLKRLNRILQLKPGDDYTVQENAGRSYRVAQGFTIIATANEQSSDRYRGIFSLSAELINRFGAGTFRINYPDHDLDYRELPRENLLLATLAASNERAELAPHVSLEELEAVARVAFISQQIFSGRYGSGFDDFISNDHRADGRAGLEENVLAPRTLVKLMNNVRDSGGSLTVAAALERFISGVMNSSDRKVLLSITELQGLTD